MFNIGTGEMVLICVVALLILGPKRLPEMARSIGRFLRNFQRQTNSVRNLVEREFLRMDLEENNATALKSMASSEALQNPPLSPAPELSVVVSAASTPYNPSAAAAEEPSVLEANPYHLSAEESAASHMEASSSLLESESSSLSPEVSAAVSVASTAYASSESEPSAEELSALREAKLNSLFDAWLENRPALFSAEPSLEAPEEPQKSLKEEEGKEN